MQDLIRFLSDRGLQCIEYAGMFHIIKPPGTNGNRLPETQTFRLADPIHERTTEFPSDCPILHLSNEGGKFSLSCWDWVPGPGPGDFELLFDSVKEAEIFLLDYFFGDNPYFKAREAFEKAKAES